MKGYHNMTTQYFKAQGANGTTFYAVDEDENIAQFYIEDMRADGVHIDADQSWHYHSYDFDLLDGLEFEDVLKLVKKAIEKTDITHGVTVSEFEEESEDFEDVEDVKQWLDGAGYYMTGTLYSLVNDADNTIKAFTVTGYSQGDAAFIWYDTSVTDMAYDEEFIEHVLFSSWYIIDEVDQNGNYGDTVEYISYMDFDDEYMLEHYNATPAQASTTITLS